jgi:hypothetical protein
MINFISNTHTGFFGRLKPGEFFSSQAHPRLLGMFEIRLVIILLTGLQPVWGMKLQPLYYLICHAVVACVLYLIDAHESIVLHNKHGHNDDHDDENGDKHDHGARHIKSEIACTICASIFLFLILLPATLKEGQLWYVGAQGSIMIFTALAIFWRFMGSGNASSKILKYLSVHSVLWQCTFLAVVHWAWTVVHPDAGWEMVDRFTASTGLILRLSFIFLDSLESLSRETRLFWCFLFVFGNV